MDEAINPHHVVRHRPELLGQGCLTVAPMSSRSGSAASPEVPRALPSDNTFEQRGRTFCTDCSQTP